MLQVFRASSLFSFRPCRFNFSRRLTLICGMNFQDKRDGKPVVEITFRSFAGLSERFMWHSLPLRRRANSKTHSVTSLSPGEQTWKSGSPLGFVPDISTFSNLKSRHDLGIQHCPSAMRVRLTSYRFRLSLTSFRSVSACLGEIGAGQRLDFQ